MTYQPVCALLATVAMFGCGDDADSIVVDASVIADSAIGIDAPTVPRILFLNRTGGTYPVGANDSVANTHDFSSTAAVAEPFPHGDAAWETVSSCVASMFAAYDVAIVELDPGNVSHMEIVVTTSPSTFGLTQAIATMSPPSCGNATRPLVAVFATTYQQSETRLMCEAIASAAGIAYGLSWTQHCPDTMTQQVGCGDKAFRDVDAKCGAFSEGPCRCGGTTQNSHQHLANTLGLR